MVLIHLTQKSMNSIMVLFSNFIPALSNFLVIQYLHNSQSGTILGLLLFLLIVALPSCNQEECVYSFWLLEDDRYVYEEGDRLLYKSSEGSIDTFLLEGVRYSRTVESYPIGLFSDRMCTYEMQECNINLRNLNGIWETIVSFGIIGSRPDSTRCFRIRVYGDFDSEDEARTCSWIESGCNDNVNGEVASVCLEGELGPSLSTDDRVYYKVFSEDRRMQNEDSGQVIHYRIYWNSKHGIIRFEDLSVNPTLYWDLAGKIE